MFRRLQQRRIDKARAYVEGTLIRAAAHDLDTLRVLDVLKSERKGSAARVSDEDGRTFDTWFWWYQAKIGELVVCRRPEDDGRIALHDGRVAIGSERGRGVVDRVPRDVMDSYLVSTSTPDD